MLFGKKQNKSVKKAKETKVSQTEPATSLAGVDIIAPKPTALQKAQKLAHKLLIKPLITEKATNLETINQYIFEVSCQTNKIEVKKAIEELYNLKPLKVRIIKISGKDVRYGRTSGRTKNWKKAIVTFKKGTKIEFAKK